MTAPAPNVDLSERRNSRAIERYADRAAPRYTSYPTVPHFHAGVDASTYTTWLEQTSPNAPVSLYLHVPFCKQLCWYCGCNMKLAARYEPVSAYVDTLLAEIDLVAARLPARMQVAHLHWGGGTPTALSPDDLERVMTRVRARFDLSPDAEIAIEGDPRTLTDEMIDRVGALGFTRASFGVQEFDPAVQAAINRVQGPETVAACVARLRAVGVEAINFDLIYGLPRQTCETLLRTVALCVEMAPSRVALFGYAHVPWMAKKQRLIDAETLPGAEERMAQARAAEAAFLAAGYEAVGIDHFAAPSDPMARAARTGGLRRNFQGYTTDTAQTLIGLGATSISKTPYGFAQNVVETGAWAQAVKAGALPVAKGLAVDDDDILRADVIEQLMCFGRVDLAETGRRHAAPADWWADAAPLLAQLSVDGVVAVTGDKVAVTRAGRPLLRVVASAFDVYLARNEAKHSRAV